MTKKLSTPFAINSTLRNDVPVNATNDQTNKGIVGYNNGWTSINKLPLENGGQPPYMEDMNGLFFDITGNIVDINKGLPQYYDDAYATLIGGYPIGSRLVLDDNSTTVISTIANNQNNPNTNMTGWETFASVELKSQFATVNTPSDLSNLKSGNLAFVRSIEKWFIYNSSNTETDNGVTVVGNWVMQSVESYLASWFATPNNSNSPQQDQLNIGYAYATSKKKPFIIDDVYYVNSTRKQTGFYNQVDYAVIVLSDSSLIFTENGKLIQVTTDSTNYNVLSCYGASNFTVLNANIKGDKGTHTGTTGEWGHGLCVTGCSNGVITNPTVSECWGDGIYIGQEFYNSNSSSLIPSNIKIEFPTIKDVRRNGLSLCAGDGIFINTLYVDGVKGTAPEACIDIEPEEGLSNVSYLKNVVINDATLLNGNSYGVLQWISKSRNVDVRFTGTTTISGCYATLSSNTSTTDWDNTVCVGSVIYDHVLYDQRVTNSTNGLFSVANASDGKGISTKIGTLDIHTIFTKTSDSLAFEIGSAYKNIGEFYIDNLNLYKHGADHIVNLRKPSSESVNLQNVRIPFQDSEQIFNYDSQAGMSYGNNVDIGGYQRMSSSLVNTIFVTTNTLYLTPVDDGTGLVYSRINTTPNQGRKMKFALDKSVTNFGIGLRVVTPSYLGFPYITSTDPCAYVEINSKKDDIEISSIYRKWVYNDTIVNT